MMPDDWVREEVIKLLDKVDLETLLERLDLTVEDVLNALIDADVRTIEELIHAAE